MKMAQKTRSINNLALVVLAYHEVEAKIYTRKQAFKYAKKVMKHFKKIHNRQTEEELRQ